MALFRNSVAKGRYMSPTHRSMRHDRYALASSRQWFSLTPLTFLIHAKYFVMTFLHSPDEQVKPSPSQLA